MEVRPYRRLLFSLIPVLIISLTGLVGCETPQPPGAFYYLRVMWNKDASTTATIGVSAIDAPSLDQKVYYDTVDAGTEPSNYRFSKSIDASNTRHMNNLYFRLEGLQPATTYYFMFASTHARSARYHFRTAPDHPGERLSLIVGGDSRNNRQPRRSANLLVAKLRPDAVIFGGDMTDIGTEGQWKEWFEDWQYTIADDGRVTPVIIARGNHERNNDIMVELFDTPPTVYYALNLGGSLLRMITLNSEMSIAGGQTDWLKADLAANTQSIWKMAQYHRPMRPHTGGKGDGDNQYNYWASLFYQYGVDVVSESDAHTVKTTWPLKPSSAPGSEDGFIRDDQNGTVYIGEGCWGAPLRDANDNRVWTRNSGRFNQFSWIFVDQREMEIRTVQVDNALEVGSLTDATRFQMPVGIKIWNPSNGEVIKLAK